MEYSSVTASSYDADALVPLLNEKAAEGWSVVSIISAGTNVVAYLQRSEPGDAANEDVVAERQIAEAMVVEAVAEQGIADAMVQEAVAEEAIAEAMVVEAVAEGAIADAMLDEAVAEEAIADAMVVEAETMDAVDEPAGWAAAPESDDDAADATVADAPAADAPDAPAADAPAEPAAEAAPTADAAVPAGWYADPSGRFELRYWDGAAWTEHVSRAGQQFTDPPVA